MRRFIPFRSFSSSGGKEDSKSSVSNDENVFWNSNGGNFPRNAVDAETQNKVSDSPRLRRSLSFSSSTPHSRDIERRRNSSSDYGESFSDYCNMAHQSVETPIQDFPLTPEKIRKSNRIEKLDHPGSSRSQLGSPGTSPQSSPAPLRCRSSRITQGLNRNRGLEGDQKDKRTHPNSGLPPKNKYIPPLPTPSSREGKDTNSYSSSRVFGHLLPGKHGRMFVERDSFRINESLTTTTVEDIYEDISNSLLESAASDRISLCNILDSYSADDFPGKRDGHIDTELHLKLNQLEEGIDLMPDLSGDVSGENFVKVLRTIYKERNRLASELSLQLRSRISDRSLAREALKQAKRDLDTRTRRLEKEKDELQSMLERELDRRSTDWSTKLEKFQLEEQRLRGRVRELAEQNVSIQREVSSLSGKESQALNHVKNLESKLSEISVTLEERSNENEALKQALSHMHQQLSERESAHESIKRSHEDIEKEAKELKKTVAKLHMTCADQEKTIAGLKQSYNEQTGQETDDYLNKLKIENVRLAGVEQRLRKDVESLGNEVERLKHEKSFVLSSGNRCFLIGIDEELYSQMDCLKRDAICLLKESDVLCEKLIKQWDYQSSMVRGFDGYSIAEHNMKLQSLRRGVEIFKGRVESMSETLEERSRLDDLDGQPQKTKREVSVELELKAETLMTSALREKLLYNELELERLQAEMGSLVREREAFHCEIISLKGDASFLMHGMKDKEHQISKNEESIARLQQDLHDCRKELMESREMLPRISRERDCLWEELKQFRESNMLLDYEVKAQKKKIEEFEEEILLKEGQISILKDNLGKQMF